MLTVLLQCCSANNPVIPCDNFTRVSDVLSPLRSWVRALYRASDRTWEEFVNTLLKVVGFLQVPPQEKLTGWVRINS